MTGNQLKMIALITMTIDHVGVILLPQYPILRIIGRLSFPIFAYMVAEGCHYTHDIKKYAARLFLFAVVVFIGAFVMAFENIDMVDCFTATISLASNVGTCFGYIGYDGDFEGFSSFTKIFMSFIMLAGRLEFYTILVLFTPGFWRAN